MNTKKQNKKKKGFTLIELIIVIAIIAILAAIAIPNFFSIQRKSKVKADIATAKSIYDTTETLVADGTIKANSGKYNLNIDNVNENDVQKNPLYGHLQKKVVSESVSGANFQVTVSGDENKPVVKVYLNKKEVYPNAKDDEYKTDSNKGEDGVDYKESQPNEHNEQPNEQKGTQLVAKTKQ